MQLSEYKPLPGITDLLHKYANRGVKIYKPYQIEIRIRCAIVQTANSGLVSLTYWTNEPPEESRADLKQSD